MDLLEWIVYLLVPDLTLWHARSKDIHRQPDIGLIRGAFSFVLVVLADVIAIVLQEQECRPQWRVSALVYTMESNWPIFSVE